MLFEIYSITPIIYYICAFAETFFLCHDEQGDTRHPTTTMSQRLNDPILPTHGVLATHDTSTTLDYITTIHGRFLHGNNHFPPWLPWTRMPTEAVPSDEPVAMGVSNWALFIINNIIIVFILVGNLTTLFLIIRYKKLQTITNSFVLSLTCADLLMGCIYPVYNTLNYTTFTEDRTQLHLPCSISLYFIIVSAGVSNLSLLAVSVDRYIAVVHPLRYHAKVTKRRANISILSIWIYIILFSATVFVVYGKDTQDYYNSTCSLINQLPEWYFFAIILPHMLVPNIISKVLYGRIICVAHKLEAKTHDDHFKLGVKKAKKEYRAAKMMALIMTMFLFCWAPYTTFHIVIHVLGPDSTPEWLYTALEIAKVFSIMNSCINPFIYAWKSAGFRKALKLCWHCKAWKEGDTGEIRGKYDRSTSIVSVSSVSFEAKY